jgi:hypothetical protein
LKAAIKFLVAYEALGFLTLIVWINDLPLPWTGPYNRIAAAIVYGPCIFLGWPAYWWDVDHHWFWAAAAFALGYLACAVKTWLHRIGTPGPLPRGVGRNLSSF